MNIKTKYGIGDKIFIIETHRNSQNENQYTYNLINEPVKINSIMEKNLIESKNDNIMWCCD